jgi:dolichol-phosphate mannosyltransferase
MSPINGNPLPLGVGRFKTLVAIPTYNEKDNIARMIESVLAANEAETVKKSNHSASLLIIDDNSPDGTGAIVKEYISKEYQNKNRQKNIEKDTAVNADGSDSMAEIEDDVRLFLIEREKKLGLGTAYTTAFNFAAENDYDFVLTMDCDFSHDPAEIAGFINLMWDAKCGMIVGSRYSGGIRVINWSMKRLLISYFANVYAKFITGVQINDLTGGFNMYDIACLKKVNLNAINSRGYAFQIEMKFRVINEAGCDFKEHPIIFYERTAGKSKMSKGIIFEAFFEVIKLRLGFFKRK